MANVTLPSRQEIPTPSAGARRRNPSALNAPTNEMFGINNDVRVFGSMLDQIVVNNQKSRAKLNDLSKWTEWKRTLDADPDFETHLTKFDEFSERENAAGMATVKHPRAQKEFGEYQEERKIFRRDAVARMARGKAQVSVETSMPETIEGYLLNSESLEIGNAEAANHIEDHRDLIGEAKTEYWQLIRKKTFDRLQVKREENAIAEQKNDVLQAAMGITAVEGDEAAASFIKSQEHLSIDDRRDVVSDLNFLKDEKKATAARTKQQKFNEEWTDLTGQMDDGTLTYSDVQMAPLLNTEEYAKTKKTLIKQLENENTKPVPETHQAIYLNGQENVLLGISAKISLEDAYDNLREMRYTDRKLSHMDYLSLKESLQKNRPVYAVELIKGAMKQTRKQKEGNFFNPLAAFTLPEKEQVASVNDATIAWIDEQTEKGHMVKPEDAYKYAQNMMSLVEAGPIDVVQQLNDLIPTLSPELAAGVNAALENGVSHEDILASTEIQELINGQ